MTRIQRTVILVQFKKVINKTLWQNQFLIKEKSVNFLKQPMFFGEDLAVQRYDTMKYPIFDKLTQQQLGYFWRPEEVSLQKDRNDYQELRPEQKDIFTSNSKVSNYVR